MLNTQSVLVYTGLAAALVLLAASQHRGLAVVAVLAAGLEVLIHVNLLRLHVAGLHLSLVLGLVLAVPALIAWFKSTTKTSITAAGLAAFVGLVQVMTYALPRI